MKSATQDSLACPHCNGRLGFIVAGNAYCETCGFDVYLSPYDQDNPEWGGLPWDTFKPASAKVEPPPPAPTPPKS